jgi:hypothetical protein
MTSEVLQVRQFVGKGEEPRENSFDPRGREERRRSPETLERFVVLLFSSPKINREARRPRTKIVVAQFLSNLLRFLRIPSLKKVDVDTFKTGRFGNL